MNRAVTVALIGASAVVIAAIVAKCVPDPRKDVRYTLVVLDSTDSSGLDRVNVSATVGATSESELTDSVGKHTFTFDSSLGGKDVLVRAGKQGYKSEERQNTLPPAEGTFTIRLTKVVPVPPTPVAANPQRVSESLPFPSGQKVSGSGKSFSGWYEVCSGAFPAGSAIESVSFSLSGDRSCGAWAECREKERTSSKVCWEFRLQGHDEWPAPGQANSEGTLKVTISRPAS